MKPFLIKYWDRLSTSFWFLPAIMTVVAIALALGSIALDQSVDEGWILEQSWVYTGGAEGASLVLSTIAGSMITISGVVFSMTLVALSLASSQLGPRILRNFMRDRTNQMVLGTFISTFVYCLLVLRSIRRPEDIAFVPHVSVTLGVAYALASLAVLIYFIHHVSMSIQADEVIARIGRDLAQSIERYFPARVGEPKAPGSPRPAGLHALFDHDARPIPAPHDGYLQLVDADLLMEIAVREDIVLRLETRPGQYVVAGRPLMLVAPSARHTDELAKELSSTFVLGNQRTPAQDVEHGIHQLVEIAVRALSPGVNDPFTAMTCVDRLGSALCRMAEREIPSTDRMDPKGHLRVVAPTFSFTGAVDAAFHLIRQHSRESTAVSMRLLETIVVVASSVRTTEDRDALRRHADWIVRGARAEIPEESDVRDVEDRHRSAVRALDAFGA